MDFIIDTVGDPPQQNNIGSSSVMAELLKFKQQIQLKYEKNRKSETIANETQTILEDLKKTEKALTHTKEKKKKESLESIDTLTPLVNSLEVNKALNKSVITPNFENVQPMPLSCGVSKKKLQEERRKEREKTKGKKWYGLPATEMTDEVKRDLEILQMRSVLDPKHFYKKNDLKVLPKYFQIGKVMDSPVDFYNNRLTKKERKKTLVDELLADAEFQKYNKRKYKEIIEEKQKTHYKAWRQAKRLKKRK